MVDPYANSLEGQWQAHMDAIGNPANSRQPTPDEHVAWENAFASLGFEQAVKAGDIRYAGPDQYRFSLIYAIRLTLSMIRGETLRQNLRRRVQRGLTEAHREDAVKADISRYRQQESKPDRAFSPWLKSLFFFASVGLFCLSFGVVFSFRFDNGIGDHSSL